MFRRYAAVLFITACAFGCLTAISQAAAQPVLTAAELKATTQQAEAAGVISSTEAVRSNEEGASQALAPNGTMSATLGASPESSVPLDVVVMHGQFTDINAKVPAHQAPPSGTVMAFAVNRATGRVAETYVGNNAPTLPTGAVERKTFAPLTTASVARKRKAQTARVARIRAKAATWGGSSKCKYSPATSHCYVVATESMTGAEEVHGTQSEQDTTSMNVPGSANGYFVDNEVWASNKSLANYWTEIGQQGGEFKGCCSLWWFYAWQNAGGYHQRVEAPYVWEVSANAYNNYSMQTNGGGIWCWYVGATFNEQKYCEADFAWSATKLEGGAEVATEAKPSFAASDYVNQTWNNGTIHTWNFAVGETTAPGLCYSHNGPYPGNINYGTC